MTKRVEVWLLAIAALIAAMVVLGGVTRLSGSGLSIVEWAPVRGVLPPLDHESWMRAFDAYRASPEGRTVNAGITLEQFRAIFLVEWAHRFVARLLGVVAIVPFAWFWRRGELGRRTRRFALWAIALGALQGAIGWLMVASGLVDAPRVSPVRLMMHLMMAFAIFGVVVWAWLEGREDRDRARTRTRTRTRGATLLVPGIVAVAVASGALMAGNHAGHMFATFPTMNGAWVPEGAFAGPVRAWLGDPLTIHVLHRALALVVAIGALALGIATSVRSNDVRVRRRVLLFVGAVALQVAVGAATVMMHVRLHVAVCHQIGGLFVFACAIGVAHALSNARATNATAKRDQIFLPASTSDATSGP